ncbi:MAG: hypothetical protein K0M63_03695 [Weeksellaceae bacterium]|nr:hypothetical protein [Weeksellaceae bacterium]
MNARVLELLKNPDFLQAEDLKLLDAEIRSTPYVQNLRALLLMGTSRFDGDNYQSVLSTTAAYTTDKKILYQLINGKVKGEVIPIKTDFPEQVREVEPTLVRENPVEGVTETADTAIPEPAVVVVVPESDGPGNSFTEIVPVVKATPKPVHVDGQLNRILFEGEEDFLEQETPKIDKEASAETGQLVIAHPDLPAPKIFTEESAPQNALIHKQEITEKIEEYEAVVENPQAGSPELNVNVDEIADDAKLIKEHAVVNFQGTAPFMPDVKLTPGRTVQAVEEVKRPQRNKHEEEMQRLIAEVERKIKEKKSGETAQPRREIEETVSSDISFTDTQEFQVSGKVELPEPEVQPHSTQASATPVAAQAEVRKEAPQPNSAPSEEANPGNEKVSIQDTEPKSTWKPMNFSGNILDALLTGGEENKIPKLTAPETPTKKAEPVTSESETPVVVPEGNVGSETKNLAEESNVPQFINTWQSWLKIERTQPPAVGIPEVPKEDRKTVIIEKFIETAPKISQLKDESSFVIREKKGDISHLMTETLANIYTEQKLYAKAIKAFQILAEKHPHKAEYFAEKVKEVKELRSKI